MIIMLITDSFYVTDIESRCKMTKCEAICP